jgi:glycerate kinase
MKIVIAPDSFKGSMRSDEVGNLIAASFRSCLPNAELVVIPMADGGEGTTDAVTRATGGETCKVTVTGPLGDPVEASYGMLPDGRTAVMEMASASGLELVPRDRLDPMKASTFGTGELMRAALESGVHDIILGIGGSATVDGGTGMAQALGYRLLTASGDDCGRGGAALETIAAIDSEGVEPALLDCRVRVACDVTNPLLGPDGAAAVFGPQKGATPAMVERLESGLAGLAEVWINADMLQSVDLPGDGAAGGLGAGLRAFCTAEMSSGADLVAEISGFNREIRDADILVTGEGKTDEQTAHGKLCSVLAGKAATHGAKTVLISGAISSDPSSLLQTFEAVFAAVHNVDGLDAALEFARGNLTSTATSVARAIALGVRIG